MNANSTPSQLSARLQKLVTESEIVTRSRQEEATKVVQILKSISKDRIDLLTPIAPKLSILVEYSVSDIVDMREDVVAMIKEVVDQLSSYLEERLTFYEDQM